MGEALSVTKIGHSFGEFEITDRVKIDIQRDRDALGNAPFVIEENLFITADDIDSPSPIIDFTCIRFSETALKSVASTVNNDKKLSKSSPLEKHLTSMTRIKHGFSQRLFVIGDVASESGLT